MGVVQLARDGKGPTVGTRPTVAQEWKVISPLLIKDVMTQVSNILHFSFVFSLLKVIIGMTLLSGDPCFKTYVYE